MVVSGSNQLALSDCVVAHLGLGPHAREEEDDWEEYDAGSNRLYARHKSPHRIDTLSSHVGQLIREGVLSILRRLEIGLGQLVAS